MAVISSPLANSLQGGLIQRVSGSAFGGGRGIGPIGSSNVGSDRSQELLENNQSTLTSISSSLSTISQEIGVLRNGIDSIALKISQESKLEEAAARADTEYQKRLAERAVRSEGEQRLENKIQSALSAPVQAISNKVNNTFANVGRAITILLTGWGLQQLVKLIDAVANKDVDALKQIGFDILRTFAFLVAGNGVLSIIKVGIGRVVGLLTGLAARVSGFVVSGLFIKPFQALINAIKNGWSNVRGTRPTVPGGPGRAPVPPGGGKPSGGKFNVFGGILNVASGALNFLNGENVDAALNALTISPLGGKFGAAIKVGAGTLVALDEIAEFLGGNLTGADPKLLKQKREELKKAQEQSKGQQQAQTQPAAQPQTPLMGEKKDDKGQKGTEASTEPTQEIKLPPSGAAVPPGMEGTSQTTQTLTVTPQTPMTPDSKSLSLGSPTPTAGMQGTKPTGEVPAQTASTATPADVKPAPTQSANVKAESLGPESKPPITVVATVPSPPPAARPSGGAGASTNVPKIRSSNPDNFYALYSQFNYNVVT
jgi:hypothetical protein